MPKFSSKIFKLGINPVVDVPVRALEIIFTQAGRSTRPIPVRGRLNGSEFLQTLVKYKGAWRLYLNGPMLKASGLKVGDLAEVVVEFDPTPRVVPMPALLSGALRKDPKARSAFRELSPSRQKEIAKYLGSLKTEESFKRNVERILRHLRDEETDAQHALMRKTKNKS
jgi:hypothetical protein